MAKIVLIEASLSFLGYGVPITIPTWGRMLSEARDNILTDPWQCIFPRSVHHADRAGRQSAGRLAAGLPGSQTGCIRGSSVMQNEPMLCVQDLSVRFKTKYGSAAAVNHVSFSLKKGEKLGLVGESGSGKVSLPRASYACCPPCPLRSPGASASTGKSCSPRPSARCAGSGATRSP